MSLTLQWRSTTTPPVRGDVLKPEIFEGSTALEAARLPIGAGNSEVELGDLFRIEGTSGDDALRLEGDLAHVHGIGRGMSRGSIVIDGAAGSMLGSGMSGGSITVRGPAGDWVGAEMSDGLIRVLGCVGNYTGAAFPGSRAGMRDGVILVEGSAGEDAGFLMRRGLIVVRGGAGDGLGRSMIAGTIVLEGRAEGCVGAGMKRGSVVLLAPGRGPQTCLLPTFHRAGVFPTSFLTLYKRRLDAWGFPISISESMLTASWERYNGDALNGGRGEVLFPSAGSH